MASALKRYHDGEDVTLYVCENGFISINAPLTDARLGSLSTRTTHPVYMGHFQKLLSAADLRITLEIPYQFKTKGEMLAACSDQPFLRTVAHASTSCGRYARNGYKHCGRCLPCLIRRAAFHTWGVTTKPTMSTPIFPAMMQTMPVTMTFAPPPWLLPPPKIKVSQDGQVHRSARRYWAMPRITEA